MKQKYVNMIWVGFERFFKADFLLKKITKIKNDRQGHKCDRIIALIQEKRIR